MTDDELRVTRIRPVRRPQDSGPASDLKKMFEKWTGGNGGGGGGGNGRGGGGGGGPAGDQATKRLGWLVLAGVLILWGLTTSFYTIDISEEGVVTRWGAYVRTTGSGMHFKIPFGVEEVIKVQSKRILQEEFGFRTVGMRGERTAYEKGPYVSESLMLTGDLNVADVEWIVQYRIADPWKFLFHARDVRRNLRDLSLSIMRRVVGDRLVGDVLTTGRVEIAEQARQLTQEVLDQYDVGVRIEKVILQGVNPPEAVKPAFNEVNAAKQEQEQTINVAEREYNRVIPEARGKAEKLMSDAEAYSIELVNHARGDAAKFDEVMKAYRSAPELTRRRLYVDAMEHVLGGAQKLTIIDKDAKGILPMYEPTQAQRPQAAAAAAATQPAAARN